MSLFNLPIFFVMDVPLRLFHIFTLIDLPYFITYWSILRLEKLDQFRVEK